MNDGKVNWRGNFAAAITPFDREGGVDEGKFIENLELLIDEGIRGLVVSGCNGESWALSGEERVRLYALAVETAKGRVTVIAGTGDIVTSKVSELSMAAKNVGVDGVMILPPYFAMINHSEVVAHYKAISGGIKFPILLYNVPRRTGVNLTPELCQELADIEYVVAIKESNNDFTQFEATLAAVGERILVFSGRSAERGMAAALLGCAGFVSSMDPHVMGREAISLYQVATNGNLDEARCIQLRALSLHKALGPIGSAPASQKTAMNMLGRPGGCVRQPLLDLNKAERNRVRSVLESHGLLTGT